MSNIKERIFGAVTVMSEEDAQKVWELILSTFSLDSSVTMEYNMFVSAEALANSWC